MTTDDLFASFGLAVFELLSDGSFQAIGRPPDWLCDGLAQGFPKEGLVEPADRFPVLDLFLPECEAAWEAGATESIESDVWTEADGSGGELYLQAIATVAGGRHFIALRSLPQQLFTYQQLAHDFELAKEKVERLARELEVRRAEAERATQAKSEFLALMSHEFRTPLNAIVGMADLLAATPLSPEQQKCVEIFQRNGDSLANLINDLLDLSKVEAGRIELELAEMDVRDVLARAVEVVEARAAAKGLSLRCEVAANVPHSLIGDGNRLRQVIVNLLGNSMKFTEKGGLEVRIELDPEQASSGRLKFAVADTGIGILQDKLGIIFDSFTQADNSTTRKYGGTGLGLNISKRLVELMAGRIWVESKVGVGSTFFFTAGFQLPNDSSAGDRRERVTPRAQATQHSSDEIRRLPHQLRVLLIDDSPDNRFLIEIYLKPDRHSIDHAENGQIGVELFRKGCQGAARYDVVLLDVEMPVMDGYQAVREIRRIEEESGVTPTPVFALTAHAFADRATGLMVAGFNKILVKPLRRVTLLETLQNLGACHKTLPVPTLTPEPEVTAGPIRIRVEEGMEDVVPGYIEKRRAEVKIYRASLDAGDFGTIRILAHNMKGTGYGYGFPVLTGFGTAIEQAAIQSDAVAVREHLEDFARYVAQVELELPGQTD